MPSGAPHTPWSGTQANPRWHRDSSLGHHPSRDSTGGALGRQAPFTAPRHRALSLLASSHTVPWAPGIPVGMGRERLAEGPGVATGPVHLPDAVSSAAAGYPAVPRRGEMHLSLSHLLGPCTGQGGEGSLTLGSHGVHRVPASLAEPWGMDSMEGFLSALLWGN